jgi:hypothetical protein
VNESLARRLIALTKTMTLVWLISLVAYLGRLDSEQIRRDVTDLDGLLALQGKSLEGTLSDAATHEAVWEWLHRTRSDVASSRLQVREEISAWLTTQGFELRGFTGKVAGPSDTRKPFFTEEIQPASDGSSAQEGNRPTGDTLMKAAPMPGTVGFLLLQLGQFFGKSQICVARGWEQPTEFPVEPSAELESVLLRGSSIELRFKEVGQQQVLPERLIHVRADTQSVSGPSPWELHYASDSQTEVLRKLHENAKRCRILDMKYGLLPITDAQHIARETLGRAYERISVLGFSFSPTRVPFAMLFFELLILGTTLSTIRSTPLNSTNLSSTTFESPFVLLVQNDIARFIGWIVLPLLALWASLPELPLTVTEMTVVWVGAILVASLGFASFLTARRVVHQKPKLGPMS